MLRLGHADKAAADAFTRSSPDLAKAPAARLLQSFKGVGVTSRYQFMVPIYNPQTPHSIKAPIVPRSPACFNPAGGLGFRVEGSGLGLGFRM